MNISYILAACPEIEIWSLGVERIYRNKYIEKISNFIFFSHVQYSMIFFYKLQPQYFLQM